MGDGDGNLLTEGFQDVQDHLHHAVGRSGQLLEFVEGNAFGIGLNELVQDVLNPGFDGLFRAGQILAGGLQLVGLQPAHLPQQLVFAA